MRLDYRSEPRSQFWVERLLMHAVIWSAVCGVAAAPSFVIAASHYDIPAMLAGIATFVFAYTLVTIRPVFLRRWSNDSRFRVLLFITYGLRVAASFVFPVGLWIDMTCGAFAVHFAQGAFGFQDEQFLATYATTILQGVILNLVVFLVMGIVQLVLMMFHLRTHNEQPGFAVIPIDPAEADAEIPFAEPMVKQSVEMNDSTR